VRRRRARHYGSHEAMTSVGDVIYLHDSLLGSRKDVMRWCMVVATSASVTRVAPRSASHSGVVFTRAGLMPEFTKDGWFSRWTVPVNSTEADDARNIGQLPEPARSGVLAAVARKRRARGAR
jgi:hypothetical protein